LYNQCESFICLYLMAKNREVPIKRYFKWWTSTKLVWAMTGAEDELRSALVAYVGGA
jgi:hypothetical protein